MTEEEWLGGNPFTGAWYKIETEDDCQMNDKKWKTSDIPEDDSSQSEEADNNVFPMPERFSDVGNALRLKAKYGDEIAYVPGIGWLDWDGRRWQKEADDRINLLCQEIAKSFYLDAKLAKTPIEQQIILRHWLKSESAGNLRSVMTVAQTHLIISSDMLDTNPWLFNCANGTIDLRTGDLHTHNRKDWITKISPVAYNCDAKLEGSRWERFLREIFARHLDVIPYLQRMVGYAMTGSTKDRMFVIGYGPLSTNGKDTLLRFLRYVFGDYGTEANAATLMRRHPSSAESPTPALLALSGRRFVYVSEIEHDGQLSESLIKSMTGNAPIVGRGMYAPKPSTLAPTFKVFLATNDLPKVHWDAAYAERVKPLPFDECFIGREDPNLEEDLRKEYEIIFKWMVDGAQLYCTNGLGPRPPSVEALLHEYESQADSLMNFISSCIEVDESQTALQQEVFEAYQLWAHENETVSMVTKRQLTIALKKRIPKLAISALKSGTVPIYRGIGLRNAKRQKPAKPDDMPQDVWDALYGDERA